MRYKIPLLALVVIVWGMMGIIAPASATVPEEEFIPLFEGFSNTRIGTITIDRDGASYIVVAEVCEKKGTPYYEIIAHHPSGDPATISWGLIKTDQNGLLQCNESFDSKTSAWIKAWGLKGTTYGLRPLKIV